MVPNRSQTNVVPIGTARQPANVDRASQLLVVKKNTFLAPTNCLDFDSADKLLQHVENMDSRTYRSSIQEIGDLKLDDTGALPNGYRLTALAFNQLCQTAAPGLSRLASEIAGIKCAGKAADAVVSVATAARIINACVSLRFRMQDGLLGKQLIRSVDDKSIAGIVGRGYSYVPNHLLVEMANTLLCDGDIPMEFVQAQVSGRRLGALFSQPDASLLLSNGQAFRVGCYIGNSEAGECSVRVAPVLQLVGTTYRCLGKPTLVSHIGRKLQERLMGAFAKSLASVSELSQVFAQARTRLELPLLLIDANSTIRPAYRKNLVTGLVNRGVPADIAEENVRWTIFAGGTADKFPRRVQAEQLRSRTVYDIFIRLLAQAEGRHPRIREQLEHAAYLLLTKNFKGITNNG